MFYFHARTGRTTSQTLHPFISSDIQDCGIVKFWFEGMEGLATCSGATGSSTEIQNNDTASLICLTKNRKRTALNSETPSNPGFRYSTILNIARYEGMEGLASGTTGSSMKIKNNNTALSTFWTKNSKRNNSKL